MSQSSSLKEPVAIPNEGEESELEEHLDIIQTISSSSSEPPQQGEKSNDAVHIDPKVAKDPAPVATVSPNAQQSEIPSFASALNANAEDTVVPTKKDSSDKGNNYLESSPSSDEILLSRSEETEEPLKITIDPSSSQEDNGPISPASSSDSDEDDSEVMLAQEMALAIANNPTMTPDQLRELQQSVQKEVQKKNDEKARKKAQKKAEKKKLKMTINTKQISQDMKAAYKETRNEMKAAYKDTSDKVKEGIHKTKENIKKEAKKAGKKIGLSNKRNSIGHARNVSAASTGSCFSTESSGISPRNQTENTSTSPVDGTSGHTTASTTTPTAAPLVDEDGQTIRMAGILWKRRSGFGKYSVSSPWERRRVVLKGTKLIYYKTLQESQSGVAGDSDAEGEDEDLSVGESPVDLNTPAPLYTGPSKDDVAGWFNTVLDKTAFPLPWDTSQSNPGARGYLDLLKEKASAAASYGHTGAPTPFAISIKVSNATKYKFCFDTQQDMMQWLAAITDVIVEGSVDAYNAEILEQNDPSAHGGPHTFENSFNWPQHEASPRNITADAKANPNKTQGMQLWATEPYKVVSDDNFATAQGQLTKGGAANASTSTLCDISEKIVIGASPDDYVLDTSNVADYLVLPAKYMEPAFYLLNAIILASRAETTLTNDMFWYVLVFFNVLGVMLINKVPVGGTIKLKPELADLVNDKGKKEAAAKDDKGLFTIPSSGSATDEASPVDPHFIPPAGSTSIRIENPTDVPEKDGVIYAGWRKVEASELMVRGAGYKANKTKVPCPQSLYECVELDVFESRARVPDMASRVVLPEVHFDDGDQPKTWNAPDRFVITVALPTDPPKLYGGSSDNGGGYTITMYCVMRQETRDILRRVTADGYNPSDDEQRSGDPNKSMVNAVRLFDEWCRRAPSDDNWMARFKVVPQGNNLVEIGLPAWISNYNGKPFLIKRPGTTGFLYRHPDKSCMEFDVSLHPFPYLAKQGICYMKDGFFKKILATLAFVIEGRSDDELPECLIGLYQLVSAMLYCKSRQTK